TVVGLQVHMAGDFVQYFVHRKPGGGIGAVRTDAFGIANHLGLIECSSLLFCLVFPTMCRFACSGREGGPSKDPTMSGPASWLFMASSTKPSSTADPLSLPPSLSSPLRPVSCNVWAFYRDGAACQGNEVRGVRIVGSLVVRTSAPPPQ